VSTSDDETDLPAQEARPKAESRLSRPHGFEGWSSRACPPPGEGAQPAERLISEATPLPAFPTLRRRADFEAVVRSGSVSATRLLVLRARRTDGPTTRIGLATPASLGGAVERNRVRRRMRALVRARHEEMGAGWDLLMIMKPDARNATYGELGDALDAALARAGIRGA
jgi:ribonuclease P protein component